jgi:hypothetical protein
MLAAERSHVGQFDSPSEAALARLKSESLSTSSADKGASIAISIGSKILELAGLTGAATLADLIALLKGLAANKDEANLIYFGEALIDDIRRLYQLNAETRRIVEEQIKSKEFNQTVANATLHITRTNVESRLKRVALLIANGVKEGDLEPESLDDMMRAAVELTDWDIFVLGKMYESQRHLLANQRWSSDWSEQVGHVWTNWNGIFGLGEDEHIKLRSALSRLQSIGLVAEVQTHFVKDGSLARQAFGLLPEGKKFHERLQEIGSNG